MDLPYYETKAYLKVATDIDIATLASKTDLAILKSKVDNLGVYKLKIAPGDLSKLSNVLGNVFKKLWMIISYQSQCYNFVPFPNTYNARSHMGL